MKNSSALLDDRHSKRFYREYPTRQDLVWRGHCIVKHPNDLLIYQEIIHDTRPDLIIETGTFYGGSAVFLADLLQLNEIDGKVLTIDIQQRVPEYPDHRLIHYLIGMSSTDPVLISHVAKDAAQAERVMVILDSAHNKPHVLAELDAYAPMVTIGCYLIVEDTNVDGYFLGAGDIIDEGPAEALSEWQPTNKGFEVDLTCERFRMTQNPGGYLRRVR